MVTRSSIRASDADRDRVAARLHQAAVEGRLLAHELEDRMARTLRARTYGDLDAVVDDLPGDAPAAPAALVPTRSVPLTLVRRYPLAVAVLGCVAGALFAAMVAAAVAVAASGLWVLPIVGFFIFRGKGRRSRRGRRDGFGHMHMHARRYGRF
jgi:hypothetical protein